MFIFLRNVANNHFTGWILEQLKNINLQIDGNTWSSGPALPPPPGTPPASKPNRNHKSGGNNSRSDGDSGSGNKSDDKVTELELEKRAWESSPEAQAMKKALNPWRHHDTEEKKIYNLDYVLAKEPCKFLPSTSRSFR